MRTRWQKQIEARLEALEETGGANPDRELSPIGIEIQDDALLILTDHGQLRLDRDSRAWLKSKIEEMES